MKSKNTKRTSFKDFIGLYLRGMAMGAADLVPGVSGGTIALITGIYDELLSSISAIHPRMIL
jgi:putative membrane protein